MSKSPGRAMNLAQEYLSCIPENELLEGSNLIGHFTGEDLGLKKNLK